MRIVLQVYAAPILFERNAYDVPVFTRVHDFMWSGMESCSPGKLQTWLFHLFERCNMLALEMKG